MLDPPLVMNETRPRRQMRRHNDEALRRVAAPKRNIDGHFLMRVGAPGISYGSCIHFLLDQSIAPIA